MSDIATRVKKIIVDKLGVDENEVTLKLLLQTISVQILWTQLN
jgi:acyl carrier protein